MPKKYYPILSCDFMKDADLEGPLGSLSVSSNTQHKHKYPDVEIKMRESLQDMVSQDERFTDKDEYAIVLRNSKWKNNGKCWGSWDLTNDCTWHHKKDWVYTIDADVYRVKRKE